MKFSTNYMLYPENRVLEQAIAESIGMLSDEVAAEAVRDTRVTAVDNFLYTRGNYEQHRFSTKIYEDLCEVLNESLSDVPDKEEGSSQDSEDWADRQNKLGNILAALGQQRMDADLFEKAIHSFTHALKVLGQEETPVQWAETQFNLGTAYQAHGRIFDDAKSLKAAVDAYTNALLVWSKDESPENWMYTMHLLGASLHAHGKLLKGNRQFQKSVVAYKNALAVLNADDYALELTATHNNRGAVLQHLGESEENPDRIQEAIRSYEKAIAVSMEQQLPIHLAVICRVNKVTAQNVLAELTNDSMLAEEVADEFEVIIECFSSALQPLCVKHCEEQLKKAQSQVELLNG